MLTSDNNPWLGLESYQTKDSDRFFGREEDITVISNAIRQNYCTVIYGRSGTGKTSLINAGLAPNLATDHFFAITLKLDHSTGHQDYSQQIIASITDKVRLAGGDIEGLNPEAVFPLVPEPYRLWYFLHTHVFWSHDNHRIIPVLIIDQFEELFSLTSSQREVRSFFRLVPNLLQLVPPDELCESLILKGHRLQYNENPAFRMVLSLREDFLARLEDHTYSIPELRKNRIGLSILNGMQAMDVILRAGQGIVQRDVALSIISKICKKEYTDSSAWLASVHVDTCILSLFCSELYNKAVELRKDTIDVRMVNELGDNIIQTFYEGHMAKLHPEVVSYLEKHLLTTSGYRNIIALEDVVPSRVSMRDVNYLEDCRILRRETINGTERIEFTHDVLCAVADQHRRGRQRSSVRRRLIAASVFAVIDLFFVYFAYQLLHPVGSGCLIPYADFFLILALMTLGVVTHVAPIYLQRRRVGTILFNVLTAVVPVGDIIRLDGHDYFEDHTLGVIGLFTFAYCLLSIGYTANELLQPKARGTRFLADISQDFMSCVITVCLGLTWMMCLDRCAYSTSRWFILATELSGLALIPYIHPLLSSKVDVLSPRKLWRGLALCLLCLSVSVSALLAHWPLAYACLPFGVGVVICLWQLVVPLWRYRMEPAIKAFASLGILLFYSITFFVVLPFASIYGQFTVQAEEEEFVCTLRKGDDGRYGLECQGQQVLPCVYESIDDIEYEYVGDAVLPQFSISTHTQYRGQIVERLSDYMYLNNPLTDLIAQNYELYLRKWYDDGYDRYGKAKKGVDVQLNDFTRAMTDRSEIAYSHFDPAIFKALAMYYASHDEQQAYAYACQCLAADIALSRVKEEGIMEGYSSNPLQAVTLLYYASSPDFDFKKLNYTEEYIRRIQSHPELFTEIPYLLDLQPEAIEQVLSDPKYRPHIQQFIEDHHTLFSVGIESFCDLMSEWMNQDSQYSSISKAFAHIFMDRLAQADSLSAQAYNNEGHHPLAVGNLIVSQYFGGHQAAADTLLQQFRDSIITYPGSDVPVYKYLVDALLQDLDIYERCPVGKQYSSEIAGLRDLVDPERKRRDYYFYLTYDWFEDLLFAATNPTDLNTRIWLNGKGEDLGYAPFGDWALMSAPRLSVFGSEGELRTINHRGELQDQYPVFKSKLLPYSDSNEAYFCAAADKALYVCYDSCGILPLTPEMLPQLKLIERSGEVQLASPLITETAYIRDAETVSYKFRATQEMDLTVDLSGMGASDLDLRIYELGNDQEVNASIGSTDQEACSFTAVPNTSYVIQITNTFGDPHPNIYTLSVTLDE